MIDEIFRSEDGAAEPAGQLLQPRRQVYRRPDASEIQPVAAADIAEQHVADMQRQAEAQRRSVPGRMQRGDFVARRLAGGERGGADAGKMWYRADRKNRQESVAHIFE